MLFLYYAFRDKPGFIAGLLECFFHYEIDPWCQGGRCELVEEKGKPGHYQFWVGAPNYQLSARGQVMIGREMVRATIIFKSLDQSPMPNSPDEFDKFEAGIRLRIDNLVRQYDLLPLL